MRTDPLEKDIEAKVVAYGKQLGCLVYKFTSPSRRSVPDRIFFGPKGQVWLIEFKRRGKEPTAAQQTEIEKLQKQGVLVYVADSVAKGKFAVDVALM